MSESSFFLISVSVYVCIGIAIAGLCIAAFEPPQCQQTDPNGKTSLMDRFCELSDEVSMYGC